MNIFSLTSNTFWILCPTLELLLSVFLYILLPVCSAVNKSSRQIHAKPIYTTLSLLYWLHVGRLSLLAMAEHSHEQMWNHTQRRIHLCRALDKVSWKPGNHFQNVLVFTGSFNKDAINFLFFFLIDCYVHVIIKPKCTQFYQHNICSWFNLEICISSFKMIFGYHY